MRPHRAWLTPLLLVALLAAAAAVLCGGASAAPLPPPSGDWAVDPGEVVFVNSTNLTVDGNITLGALSELHLLDVRLIFADGAAKRSLQGPAGAVVTIESSTLSAARGPQAGGFGFFIRVDGTLTINGSLVTGLSGPTIPNPFAETEGIHLTSSSSRVTNSTVTGARGYAITVTVVTGTITPTIADSAIENNGGGLFVAGFLILRADAVVERNRFSFNTFPHITVTGSNPLIRGNSFVGSTGGIAVIVGSPVIENNSFVANLLNAVSITQGGGRIEGNAVTAAGVAFAVSSSTVTIRNNTISFSATGLQASASAVTFDDNAVLGAFGSALLLNGTALTGRNNALESALGSPVLRAANASAVHLVAGTLLSGGGPGISVDGGSLTLDGVSVNSTVSPLAAGGTAVVLRNASIAGGPADPVVSLRGGSLDARGGEATGGSDGFLLDRVAASFNRTYIHGNGAWGIHAIHIAPQLSFDQIGSFVNANGEGDLLYEADLTVLVVNAQGEPVTNASVSIASAQGGQPLSGATGTDGRVGPVRLPVRRVDSLNNELFWTPYTARASFPPDFRGVATAALATDQEVQVALAPNRPPSGAIEGPTTVLLFELVEVKANATDPDGDALSYSWQVDDGREYAGPEVRLSFDATGARTLTLALSDGFGSVVLSHNLSVVTKAQLNRPPLFVTEPVLAADLSAEYSYDVAVEDADPGDTVILSLMEGPAGMSLTQRGTLPSGQLRWSPARYFSRTADPLNLSFEVSLRAWDGLAFSYQNFTLALRGPADQPPLILEIANLSVVAGETLELNLANLVEDPDDSAETLRWSVLPPDDAAGATIGFDTQAPWVLVVKAPEKLDAPKVITLRITATDPSGLSDTRFVEVELRPASSGTGLSAAVVVPSLLAAVALGVAVWTAYQARQRRNQE